MVLTVELTPEEEARVLHARQIGLDVEALVHSVIGALPVPKTEPIVEDRTLELLGKWRREDATEDPEELARRDQQTAQLLKNLEQDCVPLSMPDMAARA